METMSNHKNEIRIGSIESEALSVSFQTWNLEWLENVRKIPGRRWDDERKIWIIKADLLHVRLLCRYFAEAAVRVEHCELVERFPELLQLISRYERDSLSRLSQRMQRKGYSLKTQKAYLGHARRFLEQLKRPLEEVKPKDIKAYILDHMNQGRSHAYVNQAVSALRYWICEVEGRADFPRRWTRPKREKKLPAVLSQQEVVRILNAIPT